MNGFTVEKEIKVGGMKEALSKLTEIAEPKAVERRVRAALNAAAKPVLASAKERVPFRTGTLKQRLRARVAKKRNGMLSAKIGVINQPYEVKDPETGETETVNPRYYLHLVELGTYSKKGKPFLEPALKSNQANCIEIIRNSLAKSLRRLEKKAGKAAAK